MRSVKREARGISPIIATILLIAVTAVAGGVIATYVVGLYAERASLLVGEANGFVYDWDNTAPVENYKNGLVSIAVEIKSGTMRNIGDPTYGGTAVTITNPTTGFTATATFSGTDNWGKEMRTNFTQTAPGWSTVTSVNNVVVVDVKMVPDSRGRLSAGDTISILLQPYERTDAHDDSVNDNKRVDPLIWDERQTFNVTIAGRDSISFLGYNGAYLGGTAWSV